MSRALTDQSPVQLCLVFAAQDIFVAQGVNAGEALDLPAAVCAGDRYMVEPAADPVQVVLGVAGGRQVVAEGSGLGRAGDAIAMLARYTLMDDQGFRVDLLLLDIAGRLGALPLSPMAQGREYTLVSISDAPADASLGNLLCLSFARGTRIAMADGRQRAIEDLQPGDPVLTRDHGPQAVGWVGRATLHAAGPFAPVVIAAGALGNVGALIVSQQHRMFLYQRGGPAGLSPREILVQARHLVNGDTVFLREGGFVDYFALIFPRHEIIFAEGIAVESLLVTEARLRRLPAELSADLRQRFPGLSQIQRFGTEVGREAVQHVAPRRARRQVE